MAMDAKLGLVVGLGVVLTVAVTYYPKTGPRRGGTGTVVPPRPAEARAGDIPAPPVNPAANGASTRLDPQEGRQRDSTSTTISNTFR